MTNPPSQAPRQPKLRSSCDPCGAAKLRCDRGQPTCGRCLSLGFVCVYGVSRKKGKPRRVKLTIPDSPNISHESNRAIGGIDEQHDDGSNLTARAGPDDSTPISGTGDGSASDAPVRNASVLDFNDIPRLISAGGADENYANRSLTSLDAPDTLLADMLGPTLSGFSSLDFADDLFASNLDGDSNASAMGSRWPEMDIFSSLGPDSSQPSQDHLEDGLFSNSSPVPPGSHDSCSREALDILGTLSFLNLNPANSTSPLTPASGPGPASPPPHRVPLDHILRLNREASERLGRLLNCYCARRPYLALLYASIISRVLNWYHQAAGNEAPSPSWTLNAVAQDATSRRVSTPGPRSGSVSESLSPFTASTGGPSNALPMPGTAALSVVPTEMAVGTFNIDDQQVQTAMQIQLLLGEIRRAGGIISLFTSRSRSGVDEFLSNGVDSLYNSLGSWLRREHSMITDIMRSRLKELSA
ncbi:hypothetical protein C8A03DRAFT_36521 [Achaetomium macrosporum]|uniref:Zn(2)-C6 fungal-type domain-containing protein n=1 Tax=Achaetomium macrosporum TaxID=79813 RepID=A0AAN7HC64_9PEZI|nr:hypothetical protein C8A03DRAFT_36521 [Achaetomium macrosporum]